jgi:hypothetical protein
MFHPELIGNPVVTSEECDAPISSKKKNKEEVQHLDSVSEETVSDSPRGGGGDEEDKEEKEGEEYKKNQGEVTPPQNPPDDIEPSKKRKVLPTKPTLRKKSKASKPKLQTVFTVNDFYFIIVAILDASEDIL